MGHEMSLPWKIHAVLGGAEALRPCEPPAKPGLALPHGHGSTRWLSGGASVAEGWPLRLENILNAGGTRHLVLNLARADIPDIALVDELHPHFPDGFQRTMRLVDEVRARLSGLGIRSEAGALVVQPSAMLPPAALRKIAIVAQRLGMHPIVAGLDPLVWPATPPRTAEEAGKQAELLAGMIAQLDRSQSSAARSACANDGNSGSLAPIE